MSTKYTYDGYTITVAFKNEFCLSMTASLLMTGEHFMNDMVQLSKIKKDTVLATLSKKSQKNLRCEFNMVDSDPRKLVISFVVNFDYLPEFRQDVTLIQIEAKHEEFNKVSSAEIQSDISAIEKILDSIKEKGTIIIKEKSQSMTNKCQIQKISAQKGKYLLQLSGIITCPTAAQQTLEFIIELKNQKPIPLQAKLNCQSSYGYPYMLSKVVQLQDDCDIIIFGNVKNTAVASTLANHLTTLTPIVNCQ